MAKKALGKGLSALITGVSQKRQEANDAFTSAPDAETAAGAETGVRKVPLDSIVASPLQPRREFREDQLNELMLSIREHGIISPLVVREVNGKMELIAGERRWRASRLAGLKRVPVILREASDRDVLEMALIENLQREDLNPIEEAEAFHRLSRDFQLTQEEIAKRVGKNRATVANTIRLLELSPKVSTLVAQGRLSTGHAKVILGLKHHSLQELIAEQVIKKGLTVRSTEKEVERELNAGGTSSGKRRKESAGPSSPEMLSAIRSIEERMRSRFSTKVHVNHGNKKGRIEIDYYGNEDLERILELLGINPEVK
ncbi:MAG: ParB family chromosome partitioning protein [Verrucomicrobiales bacterium]|jgi:ParB family chromosome partitioning protein